MALGDFFTPTAYDPNTQGWGDVPEAALRNLPSSAMHVAQGVGNMAMHPFDTASALGMMIGGAGEWAGKGLGQLMTGQQGPIPRTDAMQMAAQAAQGMMDR